MRGFTLLSFNGILVPLVFGFTSKGDYDIFERTHEEQMKNQQKAFESSELAKAHMQALIDKLRYNAKRASLVQSRIKALDRLGHVDEVINDPDYKFDFPTPDDRPGPPIISFSKENCRS